MWDREAYIPKKRIYKTLTPIGLFCHYYTKHVLLGARNGFLLQAKEMQ